MTRATLRTDVREYLHRPSTTDLTDARIDAFIDLASQRIGRDLKSQHNSVDTTLAITAGIGTLPTGLKFIQSLRIDDWEITATTKAAISGLDPTIGATAIAYVVYGDTLEVYPNITDTAELQYYVEPTLAAADGSTNDVMDNYPYLYLWATLTEAAVFTQDLPLGSQYVELYQTELANANLRERDLRAPLSFSTFRAQRGRVRGT